eukprot:812063-Prymnesium_polylepis.1
MQAYQGAVSGRPSALASMQRSSAGTYNASHSQPTSVHPRPAARTRIRSHPQGVPNYGYLVAHQGLSFNVKTEILG